mmetsp:Transcript_11188/g.41879  ORF Transcript_11188/g.41879 Transcript_11188/m.41879 type:complete len:249 (-) Transcript_11188:175-921(-)
MTDISTVKNSPYLKDKSFASSVHFKNDIGRTVTITSWPGDGVSPQTWMPVFSGKDDAKGEKEILRFSRNKHLTEGNTYYYYCTLQWRDSLINKNFSCQLYFRVDCEWLMDDDAHFSNLYYDIATAEVPHEANKWDVRSEGTGKTVVYTTKQGDNGLYASYKIECSRYTSFGFDQFTVTLSQVNTDDATSSSMENRRVYDSTEPSGAGMRELRSFSQLRAYKVGRLVRFNRENMRSQHTPKPERLMAKF